MNNPYLEDSGLTADGIFLKTAVSLGYIRKMLERKAADTLYKGYRQTGVAPKPQDILKEFRNVSTSAKTPRMTRQMDDVLKGMGVADDAYSPQALDWADDILQKQIIRRGKRAKFLRNAAIVGGVGTAGGAGVGYYRNQQKKTNPIVYG